MDVIDGHFSRENPDFVFQSNIFQNVPRPNRYSAHQHALAVFANSDQVGFQVCLSNGSELIKSHSDRL